MTRLKIWSRRLGRVCAGGRRARAPRKHRLAGEAVEGRSLPSNIPVLLVPGEVGSFPVGVNSPDPVVVAGAFQRFADHLGLPPTDLTADISNSGTVSGYASLIDSLEAAGYQLGVDLFVVAQDWRLPIAPLDGRDDGSLSKVTPELLTGGGPYNDSVQYPGYWLVRAEDAWEQSHGGQGVPYVNLIAHSEGYLIARSYISGAAYGGAYINNQGRPDHLPRVGAFLDLAGPNEGVATIFNNLNNDFYKRDQFSFAQIRFEIFQLAYYEVARLGGTIHGPDGAPLITRKTILGPHSHSPSAVRFLKDYFRAGRDLTPTYAFLNHHTINGDKPFRNNLLRDLNAPPTPNAFARGLGHMSALFGDNQVTVTGLGKRKGRGGTGQPLTDTLAGFQARPQPTQRGQTWYNSRYTAIGGDGQVPIESLVSRFAGDPHVTLMPLAGINHITVLTDPSVQATIVSLLQESVPPPAP